MNNTNSKSSQPQDAGADPVLTPTVLVVDDEIVNTTVLGGMLRGAGFNTIVAMSGPQARKIAHDEKPDIILLDIMMTGEDGFETCRQLKCDIETSDIPIIFISALSDARSKVAGLELGAVDYIAKPFDNAEVLARIRLHLKLKFAERNLVESQAAKLAQITAAQQAILVTPADVPGAKFSVRYIPAQEAGGDFYDVFSVGDNTYMYFMADVCGHDLGASFVTSSLKALLRQNAGPLFTPLETMRHMNLVLKTILQSGRYLTAQSLVVNRNNGAAELVSAGHLPPVLVHASGEAELLLVEGDVLGVFEHAHLGVRTHNLSPGDRVFMYTDGLIERFGSDTKCSLRDGEYSLLNALREGTGKSLEQTVSSVMESLCQQSAPEDDMVLMGVEI